MKQFIDFIPLMLFFIVYKIESTGRRHPGHSVMVGGIFSATAMLIVSSIVVYGILFILSANWKKANG